MRITVLRKMRLIFVVVLITIITSIVLSCTGKEIELGEYCEGSSDVVECIRMNNDRIPSFIMDFTMLYTSGNERHTLEGIAYVDKETNNYFLELKMIDVVMFKGVVKDGVAKILYRTDTDEFQGIVGSLSKIDIKKYARLDFEVPTLLKILSMETPVFYEYDSIEQDEENKDKFKLVKNNVLDTIEMLEPYPKLKTLYRAIYKNNDIDNLDNLNMIYEYRYYDRAYRKETFNEIEFFYPLKARLKYYPVFDKGVVKEMVREIMVGVNNLKFTTDFDESKFDFELPENIIIHYEP